MFGNPLKKISEQQERLKQELEAFELQETSADGLCSCTVSGSKKLLDLKIHKELSAIADKEQLEAAILIAINKAMEKADLKVAEETQKVLGELLPPGFENMFK
jgi:nucleoid-associated protein EbfC